MDGSQTIAWVERRFGALTEAKIEARQATMRNTVEEARERLYGPGSDYLFGPQPAQTDYPAPTPCPAQCD